MVRRVHSLGSISDPRISPLDSPLLSFMRRNDSGARPLDNGDVADDDWFHESRGMTGG